jgi:hypothetical protein
MSTVEQALGGPVIEVVAKATRRRFTVEYKRKIVREADACKTPGSVGALHNTEHHHSGLGLLTPSDVHHGLAEQRVAARAAVLATAYGAHPERFPGGLPQPPACPTEVWINPPAAGSPNIAPDGRSRPALSSGAMIASRREGA